MAAIYTKVPRTLSATILTRVVEHLTNLGVETGEDNAVKKRVETAEDDRTDYNSDDDFHARVNVAFCLDVLDGGLCADSEGVCLCLDLAHKVLHCLITSFFLFVFDGGLVYGLARVVEHTVDTGLKGGENHGVKEGVETAEDDRADDNGDDDLHARVNVAFCLDVLDGGLCADSEGVCLVLHLVEKLLHS